MELCLLSDCPSSLATVGRILREPPSVYMSIIAVGTLLRALTLPPQLLLTLSFLPLRDKALPIRTPSLQFSGVLIRESEGQ